MEASVELANDQTRASLAVMLPSDYRDCIMVGFRFQPSFSIEQSNAMKSCINESFRDIDPLPGLPQIAVAALAGQEFLNASCLSIDPSTGEVEPKGVCNAAKVRMKVDRRTTAGSLQVNEHGGVEGALRRAARFKKMIDERVARNADERKLLAWLHEDPLCGKSLEAWLWTGRLVEKEEGKVKAKAFVMQWGEGESPTPIDDPAVLGDQIRQWVFSLLVVSLTLGIVWTMRKIRVGNILIETGEGPYNWTHLGKRFNRLLVQADREEHALDTRLDHRLACLGAHVAQRKLLWLCHAWENGDTFAVTHDINPELHNTFKPRSSCEICFATKPDRFVVFDCKHKCCESCWGRLREAAIARDPKAAAAASKCPSGHPTGFVCCPFCNRRIENQYIADIDLLQMQHPFLRDGGSIASCFAGLVPLLCETLRWASKATDPKERPPLARGLKLVRLSIIESDGATEGSVTTFLEDGCRLAQLVTGACATSGGLHERVTGDGRHQCV